MIDLTTDPDIGYGRRERTKKAYWRGDTGDDGKTLVFEMAVSHDKDRKVFRAYATRSLQHQGDYGFTVNEYQPFRDIARLPSIPADRYSAKALDAAFSESLSRLQILADAPEIVRLLDREPGE